MGEAFILSKCHVSPQDFQGVVPAVARPPTSMPWVGVTQTAIVIIFLGRLEIHNIGGLETTIFIICGSGHSPRVESALHVPVVPHRRDSGVGAWARKVGGGHD